MKKNKEQLLNNIIGQLEGIKKMLKDEKKDCFDVLIQMKASKSAFEKVMILYLGENLIKCSLKNDKKEQGRLNKLLEEVVKL